MKKTAILILLCIFMTGIRLFLNENSLMEALYFSGENLIKGYFWTPITSLFIHVNLAHLIGNIIFLYVFGGTLEEEVGSTKTILAFLFGGILSFIISLNFYGFNTRMLGASAAIFTLASTVMLIKPLKFSWIFLMPLGLAAMLYFLYNFLAAYYFHFAEDISIGYWGHVIGFFLGIPFGILWSHGRWKKNLLITIVLSLIFLLVSAVIIYGNIYLGTFFQKC